MLTRPLNEDELETLHELLAPETKPCTKWFAVVDEEGTIQNIFHLTPVDSQTVFAMSGLCKPVGG